MKLCLIVKCYLMAISDKVAVMGNKDRSFYRPLKNWSILATQRPSVCSTDYISATTAGTISRNILNSDVIKYGPMVKKCDVRDTCGHMYHQQ